MSSACVASVASAPPIGRNFDRGGEDEAAAVPASFIVYSAVTGGSGDYADD